MVTLPTDYELVTFAAATYVPGRRPYYEDAYRAIRVFLDEREDLDVFSIEGTHNWVGWILDFFALTTIDRQGFEHRNLGRLHAGFYYSAVAALPHIMIRAVKRHYVLDGHSLGAGLALLIGALIADLGLPPLKIAAFAPPRVGCEPFVRQLLNTVKDVRAFRYGNDPVPLVPFTLPDFPFRQVPLTTCGEARLWAPSCHKITNYQSAVHDMRLAACSMR